MRVHAFLGLAALALCACTGDFDQYSFNGQGAAGTGGGATGGTGTGATGTGATGTGGTGATGTGGSTSGGAGTGGAGGVVVGGGGSGGVVVGGNGGMGGMVNPPVVQCGAMSCDIMGAQACCWDKNGSKNDCDPTGGCGNNETTITCDGPEDCPGQICCGTFVAAQGEFSDLSCASTCDAPGTELIICHVGDASPCGGLNCVQGGELDTGYGYCVP